MKKFFNIIFSAALLLGAISCTELLDPAFRNGKQVIPEGATVTVGFAVPNEVNTKGEMKDDPVIDRIHVFMFDGDGVLVQAAKATIGEETVNKNYVDDDTENSGNNIYYSWWKVELTMSSEKRVLHFVANLPEDYTLPSSGSERSIFQSLATEGGNASYWQRVELADGIEPYTYEGGPKYKRMSNEGVLEEVDVPGTYNSATQSYNDGKFPVAIGDYINWDGKKILNGTGYYYVPAEGSPLRERIHLVRNFARIIFTNNWSRFTLQSVYLVNYPKAGFVAPYDKARNDFVAPYVNVTAGLVETVVEDGNTTYNDRVAATNYKPTLPAAGIEETFANFTPVNVSGNTAKLFMYERGIPTAEKPTALLIGGTLSGSSGTKWYKIELSKEDGSYFNIYRDMTYRIVLDNIDANAKNYSTAAEAYRNAPVGDISGSSETATLTQITDGKGLVLWVHEIDHPELWGGEAVPLVYCFVFENTSTHAVLKDFGNKVTFEPMEASEGSQNPWATDATASTAVTPTSIEIDNNTDESIRKLVPTSEYYQGCWYYAMVNLKEYTSGAVLNSKIRVNGAVDIADFEGASYAEKKTLFRDVTYTVMPAYTLKLETSKLAADAASNDVTLTIELPGTLPRGVFPLTFQIEAEDNNLAPAYTTDPNLKMPTETGTSSFTTPSPAAGKSTYYFLRTVSLEEYTNSDNKKFACNFVTTKATNKTLVTRIHVKQRVEDGGTQWFVTDPAAIVDLKTTGTSVYPTTGN